MSSPDIIYTQRLTLRAPEPRDAAQLTERISVKEVVWNLGRAPYPYQRSDAEGFIEKTAKSWLNDTAYPFLLDHPKDGIIGGCGIDHVDGPVWELGYWIGTDWWGQGYASEASIALLGWAESHKGITQLVAGHYKDNLASGHVLRKLGFSPVDTVELYGRARDAIVPATRYTRGAPPEIALQSAAHYAKEAE